MVKVGVMGLLADFRPISQGGNSYSGKPPAVSYIVAHV
jgi:hypothetical protein